MKDFKNRFSINFVVKTACLVFIIRISRSDSALFSSIPFVNAMSICELLRCRWKFPRSFSACGQMMKALSIYLSQQIGLSMAFFSKCSWRYWLRWVRVVHIVNDAMQSDGVRDKWCYVNADESVFIFCVFWVSGFLVM